VSFSPGAGRFPSPRRSSGNVAHLIEHRPPPLGPEYATTRCSRTVKLAEQFEALERTGESEPGGAPWGDARVDVAAVD